MLYKRTCLKSAVVISLLAAMAPDVCAFQAEGGLVWFTDEPSFSFFALDQGKVFRGDESFEESILGPHTVAGFDDPLEFGVANLPDGFPFPVGMTGLPNLIIQSNIGGSNSTNEDPRGVDGLGAASAGLLGAVSDVVVPNKIEDSIDLIFTREKSGVGFNIIRFNGIDDVVIRVYSTTNVFLGEMTSPADPTGANFIGVWSPDSIGRINIFDPDDGHEGADNITAWEVDTPCGDEGTGSCFEEHATPYCDDGNCCNTVCDIDPFCCDTEWDGLCVDHAQEFCASCGDSEAGSCFVANGTPGCNDAICCAIVCDIDTFCCEDSWDGICAEEAADLCGLPPENDLCQNAISLTVPGSTIGTTINATIDDEFPACGTSLSAPGVWYSVFGTGNTITATTCSEFTDYNTRLSVYCNDCTVPICIGGNDDNCVAFSKMLSTVTWCSQAGAEYFILVHGSGSQTGAFNLLVFDDGAACADPVDCLGGFFCGDLDAGSCFIPGDTPFCNDADCCNLVCGGDPFCCDDTWDSLCAEEAQEQCAGCGTAAAGNCNEPNGTPGCDNTICCAIICEIDPFCCEVEWDGQCADEADKFCEVVSPENDSCENAKSMPFDGFVVGTTVGATVDDAFQFCGTSITAPGVWYSVIGSGNTMTASTCSEFTEYNTKISVYCNTCDDPVCVDGNDDDCDMFGGLHSTVSWCSQEGAEYLILVHGFGDLTGGFDLSVSDSGVLCLGPVNCTPCPWDLDNTGSVGTSDLLALFAQWGTNGPADFDGSGVVNTSDLLILFANWGNCP